MITYTVTVNDTLTGDSVLRNQVTASSGEVPGIPSIEVTPPEVTVPVVYPPAPEVPQPPVTPATGADLDWALPAIALSLLLGTGIALAVRRRRT